MTLQVLNEGLQNIIDKYQPATKKKDKKIITEDLSTLEIFLYIVLPIVGKIISILNKKLKEKANKDGFNLSDNQIKHLELNCLDNAQQQYLNNGYIDWDSLKQINLQNKKTKLNRWRQSGSNMSYNDFLSYDNQGQLMHEDLVLQSTMNSIITLIVNAFKLIHDQIKEKAKQYNININDENIFKLERKYFDKDIKK